MMKQDKILAFIALVVWLIVVGIIAQPLIRNGSLWAQNWQEIYTNQRTIYWNAVTTLNDGTEIPATNHVEYDIYLRTPPDTGEPQLLGRATEAEFVVTIPEEGIWAVGVQTVRIETETAEEISRSDVNWSTEDGEYTPEPFVIVYMRSPGIVGGLRVSP